jgi:hypothetical protein
MSQNGKNIKIAGIIDNAKELQDVLRENVEIVAYDPIR